MTTSLPVAGHAAPSTGGVLAAPESWFEEKPPPSSGVAVDPLDVPPPPELLDELELLPAPSPVVLPPLVDGEVEEPPHARTTARDAALVTPRVRRLRRGEYELIEHVLSLTVAVWASRKAPDMTVGHRFDRYPPGTEWPFSAETAERWSGRRLRVEMRDM
jgi:hypothetical protein